ncbi:exocyst complex component 3-like protein 2 [Trichosurus vulpecula]|uniref:exocyst complex component 3-like protein 2 n=1 Tax=Trichosurus vulpecula TaxID=9337 RepID=UPI00186B4746|nr:exocyst complex component 3-like protein 2 [Trichosurus vulpecula]
MMPILKSLRMPDPKGTRANTLPLTPSRNPFESSSGAEDEEEKGELDAFRGESTPTLPNGASCHRRATLEKLVGLSPFRLVRGGGRRVGSPGDGESRSFLGRVLGPGVRRSSADFGLLARLNGARQGGTGDAEAAGEAARRLAFLRLGRGPKPRRGSLAERLMPSGEPALGTSPPAPAPPKVKEPLSVLEILSLIQKRELARADEHILELEAEEKLVTSGSSPGSLGEARGLPEGRRARDVTLLYEALQRELWALVRETLADPGATGGTGGAPLTQLGQVLAQEEEADGHRGPGAARRFRARWAEAVGQVAGERLEAAAKAEAEAMAGRLEALRSRLLEDMGAIRTRLAPAYPPSLGAFGVYLRGYHGALSDWLRKATYHWLPLADRYALLYWHNQVYPREILGLVNMVALDNGQLGPLLPAETIRSLEDECVTDVKAQTRAALLQTLQEEEEQWIGAEDQPSSLAQDVCELLEEHTDQAPRISQEFGERMAHCCLGGLAEFLQSFQQRVERFHENPSVRELSSDSYISRTITLVNCGPPLRALAERLARVGPSESEPAREAAASALDRVTRLCHRVLADLLFQELQPHFSKLMRRKWLTSSEALDGIVGTLGAQALALRRMHDQPYQALVGELHRRALVEYVRPLLRGRLRCRSARSRSRVAGRLRDEAAQLQRLFRRLESQASWLDAVVPHLAEVLQLEDTPSIQVEVGVLVRDYPDIRRKHVAALLDVRGLRSAAARHEILAVARDLEQSGEGAPAPPRDRAFFADIPVPRPPFCLGLPLPLARLPLTRFTRPDLACLPRPRPQPPARPRAQP